MLTTKNSTLGGKLPPDTRKSVTSAARAVGSFVPKLAGKAFEKYGFHSAEIMTAWPRVAGTELAAFTAPERIKWPRGRDARDPGEPGSAAEGATLVLRVDPARALDVEYRRAEIIDRINRYFGYRAIAQLKIVQTPLAGRTAIAPERPAAKPLPEPPFMAETEDPALKSALAGLWASVAGHRSQR